MKVRKCDLRLTCAFVLLITVTHSFAYSMGSGKGAFQTNNVKPTATPLSLSTTTIVDGKVKDRSFQNAGGNIRAPAHDTPASPCQCSEFTFYFFCFVFLIILVLCTVDTHINF